jgi:hypothetical protein
MLQIVATAIGLIIAAYLVGFIVAFVRGYMQNDFFGDDW